jgi:hypothetical protein
MASTCTRSLLRTERSVVTSYRCDRILVACSRVTVRLTVCSPLISLCGHMLLLQTEVRNTHLSPGIARTYATRHFASTTRHFNTCLTSHPVPGFRPFREVPKKGHLTSSRPCPLEKIRRSSDGFSWSIVLGSFTKIYQENSGFMKIGHN